MSKQKMGIAAGFLLAALTSCKTTQTSLVVADSYEEKNDQTTLTMLPYGTVVMPGKWKKIRYSQVSKQHFFQGADSTIIAVAKNPKRNYPFFKAEQSDREFIASFVKWDADYWKQRGLAVTVVDDQSEKGYLVWQAKSQEKGVNTIFVFGLKNNLAYNFSGNSKSWTDDKINAFLVKLFEDN